MLLTAELVVLARKAHGDESLSLWRGYSYIRPAGSAPPSGLIDWHSIIRYKGQVHAFLGPFHSRSGRSPLFGVLLLATPAVEPRSPGVAAPAVQPPNIGTANTAAVNHAAATVEAYLQIEAAAVSRSGRHWVSSVPSTARRSPLDPGVANLRGAIGSRYGPDARHPRNAEQRHDQFGTVGSVAITYTGTVSGSSMSGSYNAPGGGGPWSANKG